MHNERRLAKVFGGVILLKRVISFANNKALVMNTLRFLNNAEVQAILLIIIVEQIMQRAFSLFKKPTTMQFVLNYSFVFV